MLLIATYQEIKEIVQGKLVDKTIDDDYAELSEALFGPGNCFNSNEVRKRMYGMKTVIDAIEEDIAGVPSYTMDEFDLKKAELKIERQKLMDQRAAYNKLLREQARFEEMKEILRDAINSGTLPRLNYTPGSYCVSGKDMLVSLNDIHYGAVVENYWNKYNSGICREMLWGYLDKIVEVGEIHRPESCIVWANGDLISGNIHHTIAVTNKENVIEQVTGVSELIAEFLAALSRYFPKVRFVSVSGNHSRIDKKDRALKGERLDDLVEWYLKARLQQFEHVEIGIGEKIDHTMYLLNVRGKNYLGVHGDYDGSSGKVQALQSMVKKPLYAILSGHKHHNKIDVVQGIKTVMAGSFLGMDDFCVSQRIVGGPEQVVLVCDETGIVCSYDVGLSARKSF